MKDVKIKATKNGPDLVVVDGTVQFALCRCGHSKNKPFCDGAHHAAKFEAEEKELEIK